MANRIRTSEHLLEATRGSIRDGISQADYHDNLLNGLRTLVGCDGAVFRVGRSWAGARAYYLDDDRRFTDDYVKGAARYKPEVTEWCDLCLGDRAFIDGDVYGSRERRRIALYNEVIYPAGVSSIMGCPLSIDGRVVALILLYRTGRARRFETAAAQSLDPILRGLALAERDLDRSKQPSVAWAKAHLPPVVHNVFDLLLTGKTEKQIAAVLGLSPRTVHKYTEIVFRRLDVNSRVALLAMFLRVDPASEPSPIVTAAS